MVELTPFDGNPSSYQRFIRKFDNFVEYRIADPGQKLLYPKHCCRGKARDTIEECVILPNELGYSRAKDIFKELFGLPFHAAGTLMDGVLAETHKARNEPDSLVRLVTKMQNFFITLTKMKEAVIIVRLKREPNFTELTEFIRNGAKVSSSRFG
ncbi:unnamed protein product [Echinostoma caproni]|uniref:Retrotransposon protein n=1 Tax=Echinostoma caproni TaxID=27848 RepID=A0A183B8N2_9TREM|nr:unnamed protein product [Echinostoma caproni]